jgi:hypothetical protein
MNTLRKSRPVWGVIIGKPTKHNENRHLSSCQKHIGQWCRRTCPLSMSIDARYYQDVALFSNRELARLYAGFLADNNEMWHYHVKRYQ